MPAVPHISTPFHHHHTAQFNGWSSVCRLASRRRYANNAFHDYLVGYHRIAPSIVMPHDPSTVQPDYTLPLATTYYSSHVRLDQRTTQMKRQMLNDASATTIIENKRQASRQAADVTPTKKLHTCREQVDRHERGCRTQYGSG